MWKSACVGVYQLLNWKMHGETLKFKNVVASYFHHLANKFNIVVFMTTWYHSLYTVQICFKN